MSLNPQKPRKRDRVLNLFRSHSPFTHPPSISSQSPVSDNLINDESLSAASQPTAQRYWPVFGSRSTNRSPPPINATADHQKTGDIGETALQVVKESLKVVARVSDAFPSLKTTAAGIVEIFDRIDVSVLS